MIWFLVLIVVIAALFGLMRLGEKEMKKKEEGKPKDKSRPTVFKNKGHNQSSTQTDSNDNLWKGSKSINIEYMKDGDLKVIDVEITSIWNDQKGDTHFEGYGQTFNADGVMKLKNAEGRNFENLYDYMEKDLKI